MGQTYRFGAIELDSATFELRRDGCPVPLSSLTYSLLEYLLRHRTRVVGAKELRAQLWRGAAVSEGSLRQAVWELRRSLGDTGAAPQIVRTVRGRGYRFVAALDEPAPRPEPSAPAPSLPPRPARGTLLGREAELARIEATLADARNVSGRTLVLSGGPLPREHVESLLASLRRRLDELHERAREALLVGSVWGMECSLAELSALLGEAPAETLVRIDALLAEGMLQEVGILRVRFSQPLFRQVAYAALPRAKRALLHRAAFERLTGQGADVRVMRLCDLTQHAVEAAAVGLAREAVDYSVLSAERANETAAYDVALFHYDRALACLELVVDQKPHERSALELSRVEALRASGADAVKVDTALAAGPALVPIKSSIRRALAPALWPRVQ